MTVWDSSAKKDPNKTVVTDPNATIVTDPNKTKVTEDPTKTKGVQFADDHAAVSGGPPKATPEDPNRKKGWTEKMHLTKNPRDKAPTLANKTEWSAWGKPQKGYLSGKTCLDGGIDGETANDLQAAKSRALTLPNCKGLCFEVAGKWPKKVFYYDNGQVHEDAGWETHKPEQTFAGGGGHKGYHANSLGWEICANNKWEQEENAKRNFNGLVAKVKQLYNAGRLPEGKWTNDEQVFPNIFKDGSILSPAVIPFPPHDDQFHVRGLYDKSNTSLPPGAVPSHNPDGDGKSQWVRLSTWAGADGAAFCYNDYDPKVKHFGRIFQGLLDNAYFVEALTAISLRPKLAKQLFYYYDVRTSVYIARLYKNGTWVRTEIDDYVPVGGVVPGQEGRDYPICCRSEFFPQVLWPSLIEKAYAKIHTMRPKGPQGEPEKYWRGGWEAIGGGGRVEEALVDLTGGVAGRFETKEVSPDRLFIYFHELQRDTLFVARVNRGACERNGVRLNPYFPHAVNRAAEYDGRCYVQVFCGAPGVHDGGLQDLSVPYALLHHESYPETNAEGFFWLHINDFHLYFDQIFECRLTNSGDVALEGMPPPRIPLYPVDIPQEAKPAAGKAPEPSDAPKFIKPKAYSSWFEWVYRFSDDCRARNCPEFQINVPEYEVPCEVVCCLEQVDYRLQQTGPEREEYPAFLLKCYEEVEGYNFYSRDLVAKSGWLPIRDAMLAFKASKGNKFLVVAELLPAAVAKRLIFRCYATRRIQAFATVKRKGGHTLAEPVEPPRGMKWSLVGCVPPERMVSATAPEPFDPDCDRLPTPEDDSELHKAGCVTM